MSDNRRAHVEQVKRGHTRAVPYLATRTAKKKEKLKAGRFWKKNKHIYKNSKGLWVRLHGCGTALGAEECVLTTKRFYVCVVMNRSAKVFQLHFVFIRKCIYNHDAISLVLSRTKTKL